MTSNTKNTLKAAVASAIVVVAAGCATHKETAYRESPAPVVSTGAQPTPGYAMGGTTAETTTTQTTTATGGPTTTGGTAMGGTAMAAPTGGTNIVIPLQQEQLAVGTQQVPDGSVNIHKEVKNETISQPVQVRREEVVVSHLPPGQTPPGAQGATSNALGAPFQGGQVTIPLSQEKPVVSTQTVPAGNVVIQKRTTTQPQIVQGQVRREEIVTTPTGGAQIAGTSNLPPSSAQGMGAPPSGYGQSGGYGQTGGTSGMAITKPDQLTSAPDPTALVGQKVELSNVKVQKVLGDHLLAVGSETGGPPIYVRTAQPISGINTGQTINVHGIVRQTPSSPSSMGLDQASAQALSGQPIYIDASSVTPSGQ